MQSHSTKESLTTASSEFSDRYNRIDEQNKLSFYMNDVDRPFDVYLSVQGVGAPRESFDKDVDSIEEVSSAKEKNKVGRYILAGNMSTVNGYGPSYLAIQERLEDAEMNMDAYLNSIGVAPQDVRLLNPNRDYSVDLHAVNVDEQEVDPQTTKPTRLNESGDLIYTYNPNIALGVRPADCPLVITSAETPKGRIYIMTHFAWRGAAQSNNGVAQMFTEFDKLGVDRETIKMYVTPGGHSESFSYKKYDQNPHDQYPGTEKLFTDVTLHEDGYSFDIDTPNFIYEQLLESGIKKEQIYLDTSDTSALNSGYSSHGRSVRLEEDNNRDLVIVQFNT